ncbi:hypothetical protein ILUMI_06508 [Ignelater luminosus]|uniref:HTH CENPB-type domain-containing protein n=1 Tax=Ignelater luminosus TaxID=2038154 RepID=A0A8K0GIZ8_IGNLU|nr:hypothetical protein ILUMI_06508 [Ignelater luminosus]
MLKKHCNYSKEQLKNALEEVKRALASRMFGVSRATLTAKIEKVYPEDCRSGRSTILTEAKETILLNWIISVGKTGFRVTKDQLLDSVTLLIKKLKRQNDFHDDRPGRKWSRKLLVLVTQYRGLEARRSQITDSNWKPHQDERRMGMP